jgi:hypothetical protein
MSRISFDIDISSLCRNRTISLRQGKKQYAIPPDPVYQDLLQFLQQNKQGYRFSLIDLLHAAGIKMLGLPSVTKRKVTLFAMGGLYLILDLNHPDLAIRKTFGDFTSGFSHLFGVALAVMLASEAYSIPWDNLNAIPVSKKRTLDYEAKLPNNQGWLQLEAKGVSSETSLSSAKQSAYRKKIFNPRKLLSRKKQFATPTAMVGVVAQAARKPSERGVIEVIDPEYDPDPRTRLPNNQLAGKYLHYSGVARFAGLPNVADELTRRAEALVKGQEFLIQSRKFEFNRRGVTEIQGQEVIGVQWRIYNAPADESNLWLYHAMDLKRLALLLGENEFLPTRPYHRNEDNAGKRYVESFLPDGSCFGIGFEQREGLAIVDPRETDLDQLQLIELK